MKILLVDDEPLARRRLRTLLASVSDAEVVGEAGHATQAAESIAQLDPDVILLDINLPGLNGLDLANGLRSASWPGIIFVTAYADHAVEAFGLRAVDYLLKPVRQERLDEALQRIRDRLPRVGPPSLESVPNADSGRIAVRTNDRIQFVRLADIEWIEAAGNYMVFRADGERHVVRETLNGLQRRLNDRRFVRLTRSVIINLDCLANLEVASGGQFVVVMRDAQRFNAARGLRHLQARLEQLRA